MKTIVFFSLLIVLTGCAQNFGYGIGVAAVSSSGDGVTGTEIYADSETGIHGSVGVGTAVRL